MIITFCRYPPPLWHKVSTTNTLLKLFLRQYEFFFFFKNNQHAAKIVPLNLQRKFLVSITTYFGGKFFLFTFVIYYLQKRDALHKLKLRHFLTFLFCFLLKKLLRHVLKGSEHFYQKSAKLSNLYQKL